MSVNPQNKLYQMNTSSHIGYNSATVKQEISVLIQHHDTIVNPRTNDNSKKIGSCVGDFQELEELGKGAHGTVCKVRSLWNTQLYVLKKINLAIVKSSYRREALREVQLMKRLANPHVIRYYNSFIEEDTLYIIMEYADNGDLHKLLRSKRDKREHIPED